MEYAGTQIKRSSRAATALKSPSPEAETGENTRRAKAVSEPRRQWKHPQGEGGVLATKVVGTHEAKTVLAAAKAVETQCRGSLFAANAVETQGECTVLETSGAAEAFRHLEQELCSRSSAPAQSAVEKPCLVSLCFTLSHNHS